MLKVLELSYTLPSVSEEQHVPIGPVVPLDVAAVSPPEVRQRRPVIYQPYVKGTSRHSLADPGGAIAAMAPPKSLKGGANISFGPPPKHFKKS